jgi:lipopolysaccharide biosynthesis protein
MKPLARKILLKFSISRKILLLRAYKNYVLNQQLDKSDYVKMTGEHYTKDAPKKLIAYYLPQYHQIPQNDEWFGLGFTEWHNVAKAVPQYTGHWQPHLPIDVGFYNLETTTAMHRQIDLAKRYGIHGFCFYYYWFSGGHKIMEKPLENWINDESIRFPFMLFWANEDWTNTWGEQADLGTKTYSAKMKPEDVDKFVDDILPFFKSDNYITIEGRPHLIIYQSKKDPYLPDFIKNIGDRVEKEGLKRPYISLVFPDESPDTFDPREYGADAAVEFGAHMKMRPDYMQQPEPTDKIVNPLAKITSYNMEEFVSKKSFLYDTDFPTHKGAMTTFDNTARKIYTGAYSFSLTPSLYEEWLSELIKTAKTDYVFISAWNEWAEGMHLEPDQRFGYAYLQATKNALDKNTN